LAKIGIVSKHYREIAQLTGVHFNLIQILKMDRYEVKTHSPILLELLNPQGSHGQGAVFLDLFIKQLKNKDERQFEKLKTIFCESSKVTPEKNIGGINEDNTEGGRIDIYIKNDNLLIMIENKIDSEDGKNQLLRYDNHGQKGAIPYLLIYLTLNGDEPNNFGEEIKRKRKEEVKDKVISLSYRSDIIHWLENCRKEVSISPIVRETLTIYINLLRELTNQNVEQNMSKKIAEEVTSDLENFKAYEALYGSREEIGKMLAKRFSELIQELFGSQYSGMNLCFDEDKSIYSQYYGFEFRKEAGSNFSIRFQFDRVDCEDFVVGVFSEKKPLNKNIRKQIYDELSKRCQLERKEFDEKNEKWPFFVKTFWEVNLLEKVVSFDDGRCEISEFDTFKNKCEKKLILLKQVCDEFVKNN